MSKKYRDLSVKAVQCGVAELKCDLVVVPVFDDDDLLDLAGLNEACNGDVSRALSSGEFRPKQSNFFSTRLESSQWEAGRVGLVGVGAATDDVTARLRIAAAVAVRSARLQRVKMLGVALRGEANSVTGAQAVAEGLTLGAFEDFRFKTEAGESGPSIEECQIVCTGLDAVKFQEAVRIGVTLGEATNRARELTNSPGNLLVPETFAEEARELVSDSGIQVEVLDEIAIRDLGMELLLGVSRGSVEKPRLIVMRHEPKHPSSNEVLALVGKGVTFDSGGISIKPADGMEQMKGDMAGGAAVVCAMRAIGRLGIQTRVIGIVPATENMPGGRATKPGDVLTSASGTTVEVINTDAEGRLILADALWYARQQGATRIVDVATLTGACVVALGKAASGLFGYPDKWTERVREAGMRAGERLWPLPVYADYKEQLRSEVADLSNVGGRAAGACTAASFLRAFVGDTAWAHIDIAGTAWSEEKSGAQPKGATGVMVRTLTQLAEMTARQ
jgi:leucyl aminopeptidase